MVLEDIDDDAIVISGVAGRFPKSNNVDELKENLLNGEDCVSSDHKRWLLDHPKIPPRLGTLPCITKFDNNFFGCSTKISVNMDPTIKMTTEIVYEVVYDAGLNPVELHGKNIAVFGAVSICEMDKIFFYENFHLDGSSLLGSNKNMISNRLSFSLGLIGESVTIHADCISSAAGLDKAFHGIKSGMYDGAIIDSGIIALHPHLSYAMHELGLASSDGVNRSFDAKASGYTRSESIGAIFLQRAKDAKRIYAEVVAADSAHGFSLTANNALLHPKAEFQAMMMKKLLDENGLKPSDVSYVEADGTAIKEADRQELQAIDEVYAQGRSPENPLLIGSVKSNVGHALCNNTINSIIKVLIAMETGTIPPNLHYDEPPEYAKCLRDGRAKVVTKLTPWKGDYAAVNTASFDGGFSHIILKRYKKEKKRLTSLTMPRLYTLAFRAEETISMIFDLLKKKPRDDELAQVIMDINETPTINAMYRGYIVVPENGVSESEPAIEKIEPQPTDIRKLWFVFSGMGSQWIGMGASLMKIPIFAQAIKKCDAVLKPRGYDIVKIICDKDPKMFDNVIHSFLGIAAIQIGLVDILYAVGVKPDYIIGHSVGELGCSYADGCFTAEEMILCALSRGLASLESKPIPGAMAAIGLGYEQILPLCPADIDVACHNGVGSSTISGPAESIDTFVKQLQAKRIFAKTVPSSNIAFHSRYIAPAGQLLLEYLTPILPEPKLRSKRWISTSVPRKEWNTAKARLSSAEYHTNNLLSPVLFEEILKTLPKNAVTLEISPHGLLQAILKKSLHPDCINLSLTKRGHKDNSSLLLSTLGQLFNLGIHLKPGMLYPKLPYPVATGTPSISSLIRWYHEHDWFVNFFIDKAGVSAEHRLKIDVNNEEYKFLQEYKVDDRIIIPPSYYLKLIWQIYSEFLQSKDVSIVYEDVCIHKTVLSVPKSGILPLTIMVMKASGAFEVITKAKKTVATGTIRTTGKAKDEYDIDCCPQAESAVYASEDIYANLLLRGYNCGQFYRHIQGLSSSCSNGKLKWNADWSLLLEGLFQVHYFTSDKRNIFFPHRIQKIVLDFDEQQKKPGKNNVLPMTFNKKINLISCGGVVMKGLTLKMGTGDANMLADELRFVPNVDKGDMNLENFCKVALEIVSENLSNTATGKIMMIKEKVQERNNVLENVESVLNETSENFEFDCVAREDCTEDQAKKSVLMVIENAHANEASNLIANIASEMFLLTFVNTEYEERAISKMAEMGFAVVLRRKNFSRRVALLLRKVAKTNKTIVVQDEANWFDQLRNSLMNSRNDKVILLTNSAKQKDVFEKLRKLTREPGYEKLQIFDIEDSNAPKFSIENTFYNNQALLNLRKNILQSKNVWGSYRWLPMTRKVTSATHWRACLEKSGSLTWIEEPPVNKAEQGSLVRVKCAAIDLNPYEYWLDSDVSLQSHVHITEYAGVDKKGRRMMGLVENSSISNLLSPDPIFTWPIPESLSFEEAATMSQVYLAAFHILHSNELKFSVMKTILVHLGASDLGQALIHVALSYGFDIYTTYETEAEKRVIEKICPRLQDSHIFPVSCYKYRTLELTKKKGVDLVVAGHSILNDIEMCLDVAASFGRVAILYDSTGRYYNDFGMFAFVHNISMHSCNLQCLMRLPVEKKRELAKMMSAGLQVGSIKPIVSRRLRLQERMTEKKEETQVCERYGKLLIDFVEQTKSLYVSSRFTLEKDKVYFLVDDFDTFGVELMNWMIEEGATKLFVVSKDLMKDVGKYYLKKWQESGVTVVARDAVDLTNATAVGKLLKEAASLGQIGGIIDLQRMTINSSSSQYFKITELLDKESRLLFPLHVKFFIFSFYDTNDPFSRNLAVEKVCQQRIESSLHGLLLLLPAPFENAQSVPQKRTHYLRLFQSFKRLNTLLNADTSAIAMRSEMNISDLDDDDDEEKEEEEEAAEKAADRNQPNGTSETDENEMQRFRDYLFRTEYVTNRFAIRTAL